MTIYNVVAVHVIPIFLVIVLYQDLVLREYSCTKASFCSKSDIVM